MIHEGERNRDEKIKLIIELIESSIEMDIMQAKRTNILYLCSECGLQIAFEPKVVFSDTPRMDFHYDDYRVWFENDPDFVPFVNNYKNTKVGDWGGHTSKICLDCGKGIFKDEMFETNCEHNNVVSGNELSGKPCPICGEKLNEGIKINGLKVYFSKQSELRNEWWNIYRERYQVKKRMPPRYTEEEIIEQERREALIKCYECDFFVIDNPQNIIRFEFRDAFMSGTFNCILIWNDSLKGKLILYRRFSNLWVEINIEYEKIEQVINLLDKYDYFKNSFYKENIGLDGYTFALEVKYKDKYKELAIWGIRRGILYDVGMLLIKFAGKTFKELYRYAW